MAGHRARWYHPGMDWDYVLGQVTAKLGWGIAVGGAYLLAKIGAADSQRSSPWHYLYAVLGSLLVSIILVSGYYESGNNPVELIPGGKDIMSGKMQWFIKERSLRAHWLANVIAVAIPALYGVNHGHKAAKRKKTPQETLPGPDVDKLAEE